MFGYTVLNVFFCLSYSIGCLKSQTLIQLGPFLLDTMQDIETNAKINLVKNYRYVLNLGNLLADYIREMCQLKSIVQK